MARARNIKPGFFKNEMLADLEAFDRLLFIGLWCLADREGRIEDRPKRIKMELFPCDNYQVEHGLQALHKAGFIERYTVAEMAVIEVVNFSKHQSPHGTEKDSELPDCNGEFTVHERSKNGCVTGKKRKSNGEETLDNVNPQFDNALNPDSLIPDSLNPEEEHVDAHASTLPAAEPEEPEQTAQLFQLDRTPYEKIRELYNQILGGKLKRCMGVTETHRKHIRAAYNLKLDGGFPVRDGGLAFWEGLFNDVLDCPFMLGMNNRNWRADFEFLTAASKIQRFMEGKYDAA